MPPTNHRQALEDLLRFESPILELERPWQELPYDYDGVPVVLTIAHIKHALQRRIDEEITAKDLEIWAILVEGRPGIEYEDEEQISDLLFQLATPEINQPLSAAAGICPWGWHSTGLNNGYGISKTRPEQRDERQRVYRGFAPRWRGGIFGRRRHDTRRF
jgi:hypothetical protein